MGASQKDTPSIPFRFTGTVDKLTFKLGPSQLAAEEQKVMEERLALARD